MNSDEIQSLAIKVIVGISAGFAGSHGISITDWTGDIAAIVSVLAIIVGVYQHWNQKKVPETAIVSMPK